jgi:hypothetical protein
MGDNDPSRPTSRAVERTKRLAAHAKERGEDGLEELARLLFPNWFVPGDTEQKKTSASSALPSEPPERYQGLAGPETPPEFIQRVYGRWLGRGLTRAHIGKLDPKLSEAIYNWLSRPKDSWPPEIDLPTKAQQITRDLEALRAQAPNGKISLALAGLNSREAARIRGAMHRRRK